MGKINGNSSPPQSPFYGIVLSTAQLMSHLKIDTSQIPQPANDFLNSDKTSTKN